MQNTGIYLIIAAPPLRRVILYSHKNDGGNMPGIGWVGRAIYLVCAVVLANKTGSAWMPIAYVISCGALEAITTYIITPFLATMFGQTTDRAAAFASVGIRPPGMLLVLVIDAVLTITLPLIIALLFGVFS